MLCKICIVQFQPKKHALDDADHTTPTRQQELDHADQESICPERSRSSSGNRLSICPMCETVKTHLISVPILNEFHVWYIASISIPLLANMSGDGNVGIVSHNFTSSHTETSTASLESRRPSVTGLNCRLLGCLVAAFSGSAFYSHVWYN